MGSLFELFRRYCGIHEAQQFSGHTEISNVVGYGNDSKPHLILMLPLWRTYMTRVRYVNATASEPGPHWWDVEAKCWWRLRTSLRGGCIYNPSDFPYTTLIYCSLRNRNRRSLVLNRPWHYVGYTSEVLRNRRGRWIADKRKGWKWGM